jgi:hypothetical protein
MATALIQSGSFGPVASSRQGSPRGTAINGIISAKFLGGAVRPATVTQGVSGTALGNIASNLPSTGSVQTQVNAGGTTPAVASAQIAATKATQGPNITYIAAGLGLIVVLFLVWK